MPASLSLKQTVLQLVDHLQVQHSQLTTTIKSEVAAVKSRIDIIEQRVTQLVSGDASISRSINWRGGSHATTSQDLQASASPALYKTNRNISTVPDLSEEWCTGFQGGPSATQLDRNHGATWRKSAGESKFCHRRKRIIDATHRAAQSGVPLDGAVAAFEAHRVAHQLTLDSLLAYLESDIWTHKLSVTFGQS
ncbi:Short-chain dehydrogenase, partial [Globisporangium splendens]